MPTVKELKNEAKSLGISGFSKMNKPTLINAIKQHREKQVDFIAEKEEINDEDIDTLTDWVTDVKNQQDENRDEEQDEYSIEESSDDTTVSLDDSDIHDPSKPVDGGSDTSTHVDSFSSLVDNLFKTGKQPQITEAVQKIETKESIQINESVDQTISKENATHWLCGHCNSINYVKRPNCKRCGTPVAEGTYFIS